MLALDLNLASRPFKNNTLLWTGYVTSLVLLVAFSVWNVVSWRNHVKELDELQERVGSIEGQMENLDQRELQARAGIAEFDLKALGLQAFKANEVIEWRVFSWTRLFNLMEQVQPNNVRMTSIRPIFRAGRRAEELGTEGVTPEKAIPVSVEGLAKDIGSFMEFEKALLANGQIDGVFPERFTYTDSREVLFDLTFVYKPNEEAEWLADEEEADAATAAADPGADEAEAEAEAAPTEAAEAPGPPTPAVPLAVPTDPQGPEAEAVQDEGAAVETELAGEPGPREGPERPFVKGRSRAKARREEQP